MTGGGKGESYIRYGGQGSPLQRDEFLKPPGKGRQEEEEPFPVAGSWLGRSQPCGKKGLRREGS